MSGKALEKLRQEAIDEVNLLYLRPNTGSKYHVFWLNEGPPRCKCGAYSLGKINETQVGPISGSESARGAVASPVRPPDDKLAKECLRRHDHLIDLKVEAKRESLKAELREIGDDLEEVVRDHVFIAIHTLDTESLHRLADVIGLVVDAEIMRMLKKHRPAETEALLKGLGKEKEETRVAAK